MGRFLLFEFLMMVLCCSRREYDDSRFLMNTTKHCNAQSVLCLHNMRDLGALRMTDKTVHAKVFFANRIPFLSNVSDMK